MTKELSNQIESMVDDYLDKFIDAYQCQDWGINAETFAEYLSNTFAKKVRDVARFELDADNNID